MCQDVDDFVSKDTPKHVQIVGESVKKFCSGVVEDILPPLVDPVKHAAQVIPLKQIDSIGTYARSIIGIEKNCMDTKQSSANEGPHEDLTFAETRKLSEQFLDSKPIDEENNNGTEAKVSLATIVDDQGSRSSQEEEISWNWSSDSDGSIYGNADSAAEDNVDSDVAVDEDVKEERSENMSKASLCSEPVDENSNNEILAEVPSSTLVDNLGFRSSLEEETRCKSFLDEVECDTNTPSSLNNSKLELSVVYCDSKVEETTCVSSGSFPPTELHSLSDFSQVNCPKEADMICCDPTMGCFSDFPSALSSSASFPSLIFDNKDAGVLSSSILLLESDDTTIRSDEALSVAGSSGIKHEQYCRCVPFEAFVSSSETGIEDSSTIDVANPSLETIDLSDKVRLDESWGFIVEDNPVYAFSFRARKHRSYKKLLQDAFASRKRLTKEYKQLAIWYGDIDIEFSPHLQQNTLPSSSTTSLELKKSQTGDCDSEWELL